MGIFDRFFGSKKREPVVMSEIVYTEPKKSVAAALNTDGDNAVYAYSNRDYAFDGDIKNLDVQGLLTSPQANIQTLFELAYYFNVSDPIVYAVNHNTFVPYLCGSDYYLSCSNKKTIDIFMKYYEKIRLREKIESIMTELVIYGNSFVYVYNGNIITLPHNKVKVVNTTLDGRPIVEFDVTGLKFEIPTKAYTVDKEFVKDSSPDYVMTGYPEEIQKAVKNNAQYAQLNPKYCFCIQAAKESYLRYALPWITPALNALQRKQYIRDYELAQLAIGRLGVVHVTYGDTKSDVLPTRDELVLTRKAFINGFKTNGTGIVTTNQLVKAEIVNQPIGTLYEYPVYKTVNEEILAAAGITSVIATGVSNEGGTYASASSGEKALEVRLDRMRTEFENIMTQINAVLVEYMDAVYNLKSIPEFHFEPVSMSGKKALREECLALFDKELVSKETVDAIYGYDYSVEKEIMDNENGIKKSTKTKTTETTETPGEVGRPVLDDSERKSEPSNSDSGNPQSKLE